MIQTRKTDNLKNKLVTSIAHKRSSHLHLYTFKMVAFYTHTHVNLQ